MTRDESIAAAIQWLHEHGHAAGCLRYARYVWDFRSGLGLACDRLAHHFVLIPSPFGPGLHLPNCFWLRHGWLVVFNPQGREAESPEECPVVWVDESSGSVRGKECQA